MTPALLTVLVLGAGPLCPVPEGPVRARLSLSGGGEAIARDGALEVAGRRITTCEGLPAAFPQALASWDGEVAVGFRSGGVHLWDGGRFSAVFGLPEDAVRALASDGERLWIGTGASGLFVLDGGGLRRFDHPTLGRREVSALHLDREGRLHVAAGLYGTWRIDRDGGARRVRRGVYAGCFRERRGRVEPVLPGSGCALGDAPAASGLPSAHVTALAEHRGGLWVGTFDRGLARHLGDGRFAAEPDGPPFVNALLSDGETLWIATPKGLFRKDGGGSARPVRLGLPSEHVNGLALGPDGTLWLATGAGLAAASPGGRVRLLGTADGLPHRIVYSVSVADDGTVWAGTGGGAIRIAAGGLEVYTQAGGALPHDWVNAIAADGETALAGTYDAGVVRLFPGGGAVPVEGLEGVWVNPSGLAVLEGGVLAVSSLGEGLYLGIGAGDVTESSDLPLPSDDVTAAVILDGALWVATRGGLVISRRP